MSAKFIMPAAAAILLTSPMLAEEPNPEVAKAIQKIAERRAAKEEARLKQAESWQKFEGREKGFGGGAPAAPGATAK